MPFEMMACNYQESNNPCIWYALNQLLKKRKKIWLTMSFSFQEKLESRRRKTQSQTNAKAMLIYYMSGSFAIAIAS